MNPRWAALLVAMVGCARAEAPPLPKLTPVAGTPQRRPVELDARRLAALYVVPKGAAVPVRVHPDDRQLRVVEMVGVLDVDGELYINDVLHEAVPKAFGYAKIPNDAVRLSSGQGEFDGDTQRYTPFRDVRLALDSGHRFSVELLGKRTAFVLAPRYEAGDYRPLQAQGDAGALGAVGRRGPLRQEGERR